jgi:hypothetical protein
MRDLAVDPPLSAEEVRGLMIMAVDDISVPESQPGAQGNDGTKYTSGPGWDLHFGYGRNNARRSLDLIAADEIPPEVDIVSPLWFEMVYRSAEQQTFDVVGRVGERRDGLDPSYTSYDFTLEAAQCVNPSDDAFEEGRRDHHRDRRRPGHPT